MMRGLPINLIRYKEALFKKPYSTKRRPIHPKKWEMNLYERTTPPDICRWVRWPFVFIRTTVCLMSRQESLR